VTERGYVISGALGAREIGALAAAAEEAGYTSVWLTVPGTATDPAQLLRSALESTDRVGVGLGVVPLDRFPATALAESLAAFEYDLARLIVGLGAGRRRANGAARFMLAEAQALKEAHPGLEVAVGSYGPHVLRVAGAVADALVLNWMTPARLRWAMDQAAAGAAAAGRASPSRVYLFVSSAVGPGAASTIHAALARFREFDYHRRHQEAMAATEVVGAAVESSSDVEVALARYEGATPVVNPVGAERHSERLWILSTFAPAQGEPLVDASKLRPSA
jgi:alkanesulfonate monooxygenase SsuD/methylene tetrahydromethanopterin reductase-like flavin-dependent oxidoreductase (luciferase family)